MISFADYDDEKQAVEKLLKDRDKAAYLIEDAKARYIKEKTRARSKKAALEKDAAIHSKRFDCLAEYASPGEIREAYGWDTITEREQDRLLDLWDEREKLKNSSVDGVYSDPVTQMLDAAKLNVLETYEDRIGKFTEMEQAWRRQQAEIEEQRRKDHNEYIRWKNGYGQAGKEDSGDDDEV